MAKTLILGIGDLSRADAGAGVHALRYLRDHYDLPETAYLRTETPDEALSTHIETVDYLIIFDAAEIDGEPGAVRVFEDADCDEFLRSGSCGGHEAGIVELLEAARAAGTLPNRYALVGIQPGEPDAGNAPSEIVRRAMPRAAGNAAALVYKWRRPVPGSTASL